MRCKFIASLPETRDRRAHALSMPDTPSLNLGAGLPHGVHAQADGEEHVPGD
jgi:hypothetical protein